MKLDTAKSVQVTTGGAPEAEAVICEFDPEGTAHLMRLLSNLYKDAASSVLREYSINAFDSHKQAGNPSPIEVTLPTDLAPNLIITDHGVGLSRDELINVYSRYGASTKRDSNDQVGAFGLGAKSAFTLGQQFMVTGVKDGHRTVAVFALNEKGVGTVTILGCDTTTDPNGVSVSISVDKPRDMQLAAPKVFSAWPPGSVLVNGKPPRSVLESANSLRLTEHIVLATGDQYQGKMTVVMGNIGYPVLNELSTKIWRDWQSLPRYTGTAYVFVDVGDVDIAPSREAMRDTPRTLDRLKRIVPEFRDGVTATVNQELATAPTLSAAAQRVASLESKWGLAAGGYPSPRPSYSWRGQLIELALNLPYPGVDYFGPWDNTSRHYQGYQLTLHQKGELQVITEVPRDKVETAMRAVRPFLAQDSFPVKNTYRREHVTLIFTPPGSKPVGWFEFGKPDTFPSLPFEEYLAQARAKKPAAVASAPRRIVSYKTQVHGERLRWRNAAEIAALGLPVVLAENEQEKKLGIAFAERVVEGAVLVKLHDGRTQASLERQLGKKFQFPVITLDERVTAVATEIAKSSSAEAYCAAQTPFLILRKLAVLRERITHPAVTAVLDAAAGGDAISGARAARPQLFPAPLGLQERFPLLQAIPSLAHSAQADDHIVSYLNKVPRRRGRKST